MKKTLLLALLLLSAAACCNRHKMSASTEELASTEVTSHPAPVSGGYSAPRTLKESETELFRSATSGLKGVVYTPETVSTQVVAGMNYKFYCSARTMAETPHIYNAEIVVFKPLPCNHEEPRITSITRVAVR